MFATLFPEMLANFIGNLLADGMLYPLETVLHRLYIQGTRTIIDNTDTGADVIPISTNYEGVLDCFRSIVVEEGMSGFYKGFGALVLQYAIQAAILRLSKYLFEKISQELYPPQRTIGYDRSYHKTVVSYSGMRALSIAGSVKHVKQGHVSQKKNLAILCIVFYTLGMDFGGI